MIRHIQIPIYAALLHPCAAAYIRVQLLTYARTTLRIQGPLNTMRQYDYIDK